VRLLEVSRFDDPTSQILIIADKLRPQLRPVQAQPLHRPIFVDMTFEADAARCSAKQHQGADFGVPVLEEAGDVIGLVVATPADAAKGPDLVLARPREPRRGVELNLELAQVVVDFGTYSNTPLRAIALQQLLGRRPHEFRIGTD